MLKFGFAFRCELRLSFFESYVYILCSLMWGCQTTKRILGAFLERLFFLNLAVYIEIETLSKAKFHSKYVSGSRKYFEQKKLGIYV